MKPETYWFHYKELQFQEFLENCNEKRVSAKARIIEIMKSWVLYVFKSKVIFLLLVLLKNNTIQQSEVELLSHDVDCLFCSWFVL